ncbi:MAG: lipoyl(octanoyl) transferase LipB [Longimicrobiales bacterium]|nr:lipoyl(octanoyl) transferase LipB [Longimicrobiales bacterium]
MHDGPVPPPPGPEGPGGGGASAPQRATPARGVLEVRTPGRVPYAEALALQERLVAERRAGRAPDTLLLLEHPPVITLGTGSAPGHVLVGAEERARLGVELFETGRGGDVTYHGPGQLVGYPILDLKPDRRDLHRYLRDLEEALIRTVARFGVRAWREEGLTGVWTDAGKVAAIGVRVSSGWITSHGFALNVDPDLSHFGWIVPCGIADRAVASLAGLVGRPVPVAEVAPVAARELADVFGLRPRQAPGPETGVPSPSGPSSPSAPSTPSAPSAPSTPSSPSADSSPFRGGSHSR